MGKGLGVLGAALLAGCGGEALRVSVGDPVEEARRVFDRAGLEAEGPGPPLFPEVACDGFDAYHVGDRMVLVYFKDGVVVGLDEGGRR